MPTQYDVVTVGGGLAGAALAKRLAEYGQRVLVLEQTTVFRDRVRGEQMHCWGVAEARALGLYDLLLQTCGHEVRYWSSQFLGFGEPRRRDLFETSPHRAGSLNFCHPEMQEVVLGAAERAGATVRAWGAGGRASFRALLLAFGCVRVRAPSVSTRPGFWLARMAVTRYAGAGAAST